LLPLFFLVQAGSREITPSSIIEMHLIVVVNHSLSFSAVEKTLVVPLSALLFVVNRNAVSGGFLMRQYLAQGGDNAFSLYYFFWEAIS